MGKLPELVLAVRNANIESYDEEGQVTLSGKYILENPDASVDAVSLALWELTKDRDIAYGARLAEAMRRQGFLTRAHSLYNSYSDRLEEHLARIAERSPIVAELARNRFLGVAPTKRNGRQRLEGFLERVLSSGEEDSDTLVSLADVEEVLTLVFELLGGRSFPLFTIEYAGDLVFTQLSQKLDDSRRDLRAAIHVRNNRLRALAETLNEAPEIHRVAAAIPVLSSVDEVHGNIEHAIENLHDHLLRESYGAAGRQQSQGERQRAWRLWREVTRLYERLYHANLEVRKKHLALYRAVKQYEDARQRYRRRFRMRLLTPASRGPGVRIHERWLSLSDQQKLSFAKELRDALEGISVRRRFFRAVHSEEGRARRYLSPAGYKALALEMLLIVGRYVPVDRPRVQYAIEGTNAPNLGALELGLTQEARLGRGLAMIREIRTRTARSVERLASALLYYHEVEISEEAYRYLEEHYRVSRERIQQGRSGEQERKPVPSPAIKRQLLHIPPPPESHKKLAERLQRRLGRYRVSASA
jgi:hypothetical protein